MKVVEPQRKTEINLNLDGLRKAVQEAFCEARRVR